MALLLRAAVGLRGVRAGRLDRERTPALARSEAPPQVRVRTYLRGVMNRASRRSLRARVLVRAGRELSPGTRGTLGVVGRVGGRRVLGRATQRTTRRTVEGRFR